MTIYTSALIIAILILITVLALNRSKKKELQFGVLNTESGEFSEGYVENGQMKYKKPKIEPVTEKIGVILFNYTKTRTGLFPSSNVVIENLIVFRQKDPSTGKTVRIFAESPSRGILEFDVWAWETQGKRVFTNDPFEQTLEEALGWA